MFGLINKLFGSSKQSNVKDIVDEPDYSYFVIKIKNGNVYYDYNFTPEEFSIIYSELLNGNITKDIEREILESSKSGKIDTYYAEIVEEINKIFMKKIDDTLKQLKSNKIAVISPLDVMKGPYNEQ